VKWTVPHVITAEETALLANHNDAVAKHKELAESGPCPKKTGPREPMKKMVKIPEKAANALK